MSIEAFEVGSMTFYRVDNVNPYKHVERLEIEDTGTWWGIHENGRMFRFAGTDFHRCSGESIRDVSKVHENGHPDYTGN